MRYETNDDRAAYVLATAEVIGDKAAAKRHGTTTRSIRRWRKRCLTDKALSAAVLSARARLGDEWREQVPSALCAAVRWILKSVEVADPADPEAIAAMTKAISTLGELEMYRRWMDDRLSAQARPVGAASLQVVPGGRSAAG